jgi:hypothetical protein
MRTTCPLCAYAGVYERLGSAHVTCVLHLRSVRMLAYADVYQRLGSEHVTCVLHLRSVRMLTYALAFGLKLLVY